MGGGEHASLSGSMDAGVGLKIRRFENRSALGRAAAVQAAEVIRNAVLARGKARILAGNVDPPIEFLAELTRQPDIAWNAVELFQLNEYIGLGVDHPASCRLYLHQHLIRATRLGRYHLLDGEHDPERVCRDEGRMLASAPVDVVFAGITANGGLAFNDPPADFMTEAPYLTLRLDETSRRQRVDEGAFASLRDVPERAISISIRQLLKAKAVLCLVADAHKADAVRRCLEGSISPLAPASILRTHGEATVYLDKLSSSLLANPPGLEP
jgi:glucosamine-6-phosphate deaminase